MATQLAAPRHHGYTSSGEGRDDAAISALGPSNVIPGQYFVVRANRPGYVAEPTKLGKGRELTDQGLFAVSPKEAMRFIKRATQARLGEMAQRERLGGQVSKQRLIGTLRELQASRRA